MRVWHQIGARIKHPRTNDGARPELVPPLVILTLVPLSALWLTVTLVYSYAVDFPSSQLIAFSISGGVLPIAVAYGVMTNRRWTREIFLLAFGLWTAAFGAEWYGGTNFVFDIGYTEVVLIVILVLWTLYLYGSKASRKYYLLLADKPIPDNLEPVTLGAVPRWLRVVTRPLPAIGEWVLIALALFIAFGWIFLDRW